MLVGALFIGLLAGCAVGLPCYWYGWRIGSGPRVSCFWGHAWEKYGLSQVVENSRGEPVVAQRRVCSRCDAADWRRITLHN